MSDLSANNNDRNPAIRPLDAISTREIYAYTRTSQLVSLSNQTSGERHEHQRDGRRRRCCRRRRIERHQRAAGRVGLVEAHHVERAAVARARLDAESAMSIVKSGVRSRQFKQ